MMVCKAFAGFVFQDVPVSLNPSGFLPIVEQLSRASGGRGEVLRATASIHKEKQGVPSPGKGRTLSVPEAGREEFAPQKSAVGCYLASSF